MPKIKLLLATGNPHKAEEMRAILADAPVDLELVSLTEAAQGREILDPPETGKNYLENALIKAKHYGNTLALPCLADDSGLEIEALQGAPGLYSHRFLADCHSQAEKNARVLEILKDKPSEERRARFRCTAVIYGLSLLALKRPGVELDYLSAVATCEGSIAFKACGKAGFGYDPIFLTDDRGCCMAELDAAEKNSISHRGKAVRAVVQQLADLLKN